MHGAELRIDLPGFWSKQKSTRFAGRACIPERQGPGAEPGKPLPPLAPIGSGIKPAGYKGALAQSLCTEANAAVLGGLHDLLARRSGRQSDQSDGRPVSLWSLLSSGFLGVIPPGPAGRPVFDRVMVAGRIAGGSLQSHRKPDAAESPPLIRPVCAPLSRAPASRHSLPDPDTPMTLQGALRQLNLPHPTGQSPQSSIRSERLTRSRP